MAVGDIINSDLLGNNAWFYFRPASGVEIIITSVQVAGASQHAGLTSDSIAESYGTITNGGAGLNVKIGITYTNYLTVYGTDSAGYTGVQTK